ncbi:MAG: hypothetical protein H7A21_16050 [Spirochaetales bacterium]|nr:hypothetical protein [Leptospiraceae bacterium]MCP5482951.1 hypothetical protein [Spirochaetales bacterium]MCP5484868.1 hypothetical protein [Spirochaetales bacterium]
MDQRAFLHEILSTIRRFNNAQGKDPIPTTDIIFRHVQGDLVQTRAQLGGYMKKLEEANAIFIIHMVEPDPILHIDAVNGYVLADSSILGRVREFYYQELERLYERQMYQRKHASGIIRELFKEVKRHNNTRLGMVLNGAIMLQQYEQVVSGNPAAYGDAERDRRITAILEETAPLAAVPGSAPLGDDPEFDVVPPGSEGAASQNVGGHSQRAVDSSDYLDVEKMDLTGKWGEAVEKFGVQFLLRVHFRKYEFDKVKLLVNTKRVARREDLIYVRDTIRMLEGRIHQDPPLRKHLKVMSDLQAAVLIKLKMIELARQDA